MTKTISRRIVAWLSILLLLASILPLYALSFYNHACYDDFGFSLLTHAAWQNGEGLAGVLHAAWQNTVGIRQTWEGTYTSSLISALQPAIFGESLYWLTTFLLLTVFLLSLWFFLRQALGGVLKADSPVIAAAVGLLGFVAVQFVPSAAEGFFWFNGGVAYTLMASLLLCWAGVWLRLERSGGARAGRLFALLLLLTVAVGGAKYSTVLFASLLAACFTGWAFIAKRPKRWAYAALTLLLLVCFIFSVRAPGNTVRAQTLSGGMSAPKAVAEAVYFGLALIGNFFSLPLLGAILAVTALALPALRKSNLRFAHPVWVTLIAVALFCAQLTPTLYTGNYLGDGRTVNTYWFTYVLTACLLALYWAGFLLKRFGSAAEPARDSRRVRLAPLLVAAVLLVAGCVGYHPEGAQSYGPQNMAGGSALRAIISGEAAAYDRAMDARDATLNDSAKPDVTLTPVADAPACLMGDALLGNNVEYMLNLYAEYYQKSSITLAGGEE